MAPEPFFVSTGENERKPARAKVALPLTQACYPTRRQLAKSSMYTGEARLVLKSSLVSLVDEPTRD